MLGVFFQLPLGRSTSVQSFTLASKTERFWCFATLLTLETGVIDGRLYTTV